MPIFINDKNGVPAISPDWFRALADIQHQLPDKLLNAVKLLLPHLTAGPYGVNSEVDPSLLNLRHEHSDTAKVLRAAIREERSSWSLPTQLFSIKAELALTAFCFSETMEATHCFLSFVRRELILGIKSLNREFTKSNIFSEQECLFPTQDFPHIQASIKGLTNSINRFYRQPKEFFDEMDFKESIAQWGIVINGAVQNEQLASGIDGLILLLSGNYTSSNWSDKSRFILTGLPAYESTLQATLAEIEGHASSKQVGFARRGLQLIGRDEEDNRPQWIEIDGSTILADRQKALEDKNISEIITALEVLKDLMNSDISKFKYSEMPRFTNNVIYGILKLNQKEHSELLTNALREMQKFANILSSEHIHDYYKSQEWNPSDSHQELYDLLQAVNSYLVEYSTSKKSDAHLINYYDSTMPISDRDITRLLEIQNQRISPNTNTNCLKTAYSKQQLREWKNMPGSYFILTRNEGQIEGFVILLTHPNTFPSYAQNFCDMNQHALGSCAYVALFVTAPDAQAKMSINILKLLTEQGLGSLAKVNRIDSAVGWVREDNRSILAQVKAGANPASTIIEIQEDEHTFFGFMVTIPFSHRALNALMRTIQLKNEDSRLAKNS